LGILDRGHLDGHRDRPAALGDANRLESFHWSSLAYQAEDMILFREAIRGDQRRDRFSDNFMAPITQQALGAFIPGLDHAVEVLGDYRLPGGLHDRCEA